MPERDTEWRCVHVYRYVDQDGFLVDGLAPLIAAVSESGVPHRFFFLRYWQGGHHIRVRLRLPVAIADEVMADVTAKLAGYLGEHPSGQDFDHAAFASAQPTMAFLEGERPEPIQPPDTIRVAAYLPEYGKYGGPRGVAIAEDFFAASSAIALTTLTQTPRGPGTRLGPALSMMLRGLTAAGLGEEQMAAFFAHYSLMWAPYVFDSFLNTWPDLLAAHREPVLAHAMRLLGLRHTIADPFTVALRTAWSRVQNDAATVLPRITLAGPDAPDERRQQVLLVSYVHTHNNRLGLIPEQEAFLGFLGHQVLSQLAGILARPDLPKDIRGARARRLGQ